MRTILRFYASNPMSFIGGTFSAHLYYEKAKEDLSVEFGMAGDERHSGAVAGKGKYESRGWKFTRAEKHNRERRTAVDEQVKFVDFEDLYISILEKTGQSSKRQSGGQNTSRKDERPFRPIAGFRNMASSGIYTTLETVCLNIRMEARKSFRSGYTASWTARSIDTKRRMGGQESNTSTAGYHLRW